MIPIARFYFYYCFSSESLLWIYSYLVLDFFLGLEIEHVPMLKMPLQFSDSSSHLSASCQETPLLIFLNSWHHFLFDQYEVMAKIFLWVNQESNLLRKRELVQFIMAENLLHCQPFLGQIHWYFHQQIPLPLIIFLLSPLFHFLKAFFLL